MEAAKVAQAEAAKLAAIGTDKAASPSNAKLAEAAVVAGATAAKELKKAKKESDAEKNEKSFFYFTRANSGAIHFSINRCIKNSLY
ncbi:MAG: hypothetical protein RJB43_788 [Verrucomicrobiota bacterium]